MRDSQQLRIKFLAALCLFSSTAALFAQEKPAKPKSKAKPGMAAEKPAKPKGKTATKTTKPVGKATNAATAAVGAERLRKVAPYINEETMAVGYIDLARIDVHRLLTSLGAKSKVTDQDVADLEKEFKTPIDAFLKAGGSEVFLLFPYSVSNPMYLVPVSPGQKEEELLGVLSEWMDFKPDAAARVGEMIVVGGKHMIEYAQKTKSADRPDVEAAFQFAGDSAVQFVLAPNAEFRANLEKAPPLPPQFGPAPFQVLSNGVQWSVLAADSPLLTNWTLTIQSKDAAAAKDLHKLAGIGMQPLLEMFLQESSPPWLNFAEVLPPAEIAESLTPNLSGDRLVLAVDEKNDTIVRITRILERFGPGLGATRSAVRRTQASNNLKLLGLAMHSFADSNRHFPRDIRDAKGKPLLSWRVWLLPNVDAAGLFKEFHRDEPWDSPHNKELIKRMPDAYRSPGMKMKERGLTTYLAPTGDTAIFNDGAYVEYREISDGTSKTIMLLDVDDEHAVIWTKPDDWELDLEKPLHGLAGRYPDDFLTLFADGVVHSLKKDLKPETLRALFTRNGGEEVDGF